MALPAKIDLTSQLLSAINKNSGATLDNLYIYRIGTKKYVTSQENFLGGGANGQVYKAFPVTDNGEVDFATPVALKVCNITEKDQEELLKTEISVLRAAEFRHVSDATFFKNVDKPFAVFTMEYFDAKPLNHPDTIKLLNDLTLAERLDLIRQGALFLSLIHSKRDKHPAFLLADIKPENVLLETKIINGEKVYFLIPIDFGSASKLKENTPQETKAPRGTITTVAPELYKGSCGPKSDIYSFVSIVLMLLNVNNPSILIDENYSLRGDYSMAGFLNELSSPHIDPEKQAILETLIKKFVFRMRDKEYHSRAETTETLAFFNYANQVCALYEKLNTIKKISDFDLSENEVALLKNLFTSQITPFFKTEIDSLSKKQHDLIETFSLEKLRVILPIPSTKLAENWRLVKTLHTLKFEENLSEKKAGMQRKAELKKLTPRQCQILDELTPEMGKIIETFSDQQKDVLRHISDTQYKLLKEMDSDNKLMTMSLPNKLVLQEVVARINPLERNIDQKDITTELCKMSHDIEEHITILLTKMSILTATTGNGKEANADEVRMRLCQQYSSQDNPEISTLILLLMLLDAENYNIDYGNYKTVISALESSSKTNCLTVFLLECLCNGGKENKLVAAMINLNNIGCLTPQFVKLFKDKSELALQVAEAIIGAGPEVIKRNKQQLNDLLDGVLSSKKSFSNLFSAPIQSAMKEKIFELLGFCPTASNTFCNNINPIVPLDAQSPMMVK